MHQGKMCKLTAFVLSFLLLVVFTGCEPMPTKMQAFLPSGTVPAYTGSPYTEINGNVPVFSQDVISDKAYESYTALDALGRCGVCIASVGLEVMPTEARESISQVRPTAWQSVTYDHIDGDYLYNRCHLIGFQLTAENANDYNLITGTRYMNVEGMLPFENQVAAYVKETGNHVMYRATPVFEGDDLLARGVFLEGYSVEDKGAGVSFYVFCHNVQPGVVIDYATGESYLAEETAEKEAQGDYVLNTKSKKFHLPTCSGVETMNENNKEFSRQSREEIMEKGYQPCQNCNP